MDACQFRLLSHVVGPLTCYKRRYFYGYFFRFKDSSDVVDAFNVDPLYLKHENQGAVPDYRVCGVIAYIIA